MNNSINSHFCEELNHDAKSAERIQISYSKQESACILSMEDYLMKAYSCNRSQLHKNLVKKEYALHHQVYKLL